MSTPSVLNTVLAATTGSSGGLDVDSLVSTILYADRAPEREWQAQQATLASQSNALSGIAAQASTLTDSLGALQDPLGALNIVLTNSSNRGLVTGSAVAGTANGSHTVIVNSLATTGSWYSSTVSSSSATLSSGSFSLTVGSTTTNITIGSGVDTLDDLATSINSQSLGVNATVITDSSGARLSLVAQSSGTAGDLSITHASGLTFTQANAGANASLVVDGVPISSASNTVTGAVSGLTIDLLGAAPGVTVTLTVAADVKSALSAVTAFVTDYNSLIKSLNAQFTYNSATKSAGVLSADSTITMLQQELLASSNFNLGSGTLQTLDSIGVSTTKYGTLTLNSAALAKAVTTNSTGVAEFFQGSASNGFAAALRTSLATYTDPSSGAFSVDLSSNRNESKDLDAHIASLESYLATKKTALTLQYNKVNVQISELPGKLRHIQAVLGASRQTP